MKRKTTKLEKKLLDNGFYLLEKTYKGTHSQFTHNYVYVGNVENCTVKVCLDIHREKVDNYTIENTLPQQLYHEHIDMLARVFSKMFDIIHNNQEEIVEILECENE